MGRQWFVDDGELIHGPMSSAQLRALARDGKLPASSRIRVGRDGLWTPAHKVKGLWDAPQDSPRTPPSVDVVPPLPRDAVRTEVPIVPPESTVELPPTSEVASTAQNAPPPPPFEIACDEPPPLPPALPTDSDSELKVATEQRFPPTPSFHSAGPAPSSSVIANRDDSDGVTPPLPPPNSVSGAPSAPSDDEDRAEEEHLTWGDQVTAPLEPFGQRPPRRALSTLQLAIICVSAIAGLALWRFTSKTEKAEPESADSTARAVAGTPRKLDLAWTRNFPNPVSEQGIFSLTPMIEINKIELQLTPELAKVRLVADLLRLAQDGRPRKGLLFEGYGRPQVANQWIYLGPLPIPANRCDAELYSALASTPCYVNFVIGFDVELDFNTVPEEDGLIIRARPMTYYLVRVLEITDVSGSEAAIKRMSPFVGRRFELRY